MERTNLDPNIINKLFTVICCGLDLESEAPELTAADLAAIFSVGMKQSIQPILYRGLKNRGAPEETVQAFDKARMRDTYFTVQFMEAAKAISAAFDENGIPYVLLKGAVIRDLYPAPELRTSSDIDVLVHEEDLERAVEVLEARTDFRTLQRDFHNVSMINSRVHLELHFTLKHSAENLDWLLDRAWDYAVWTGEGNRWAFTPEYQIFYVTAHMSRHCTKGGLGIRPLIDLWLLRHKTQFDEAAMRKMCDECSILTFYEACCALSEVWFGGGAHTETTRMLEDFCLSGGVFGSERSYNAGMQTTKRGWRYLASRIFPPVDEVKAYYPDASGKDRSAAYYYGKRLVSWFSRSRRAKLKNRFNVILTTDEAYLDSVDDLFRRLGLR